MRVIALDQCLRVLEVGGRAQNLELLRIYGLVAVEGVRFTLDAASAALLLLGWAFRIRIRVAILKCRFPLVDDLHAPLRGLVELHRRQQVFHIWTCNRLIILNHYNIFHK